MKFHISEVVKSVIFNLNYTKLNLVKTLLINFKMLPFGQAVKLPILLYGGVDTYFLEGEIEFKDCEIKRGLIRMGHNKEYMSNVKGNALIILEKGSKITFHGNVEVSSSFLIRVGKGAHLSVGKDVFLGASVKVVCIKRINIGAFTRIGFESQLIDSNLHYVYDLEKKSLMERDGEIEIERYNWIGNRTTISKNTKTKPFTIVTSSSLLNKDYTKFTENYMIIGGQPAEMISQNKRRIYSSKLEKSIIDNYTYEDGLEKDILDYFSKID